MPSGYEQSPDYGGPRPTRWGIAVGVVALAALPVVAMLTIARGEDPIVGSAHVHDGDSLNIAGFKIRLEGIDAPEIEQVCLTSSAERWDCGITARDKLRAKIGMGTVKCEPEGKDQYGRTLAVCYAENDELNAWLVREGWALSFVRYGDRYRAEENDAKANERGLWSGAFIAPWDWRHRSEHTEILGATQVPIDAQTLLLRP